MGGMTDRFAMVDHTVDSSAPPGRIEIRGGVGRRRRWSAEEKGGIVAASFAPGAVVSEVARRHGILPQHLFAWRKAARGARLAFDGTLPEPSVATRKTKSRSRVVEGYRHMASRCLLLAAKTTEEQHKSVLLRAAAKLNELADRQESIHRTTA
jgi:transposase